MTFKQAKQVATELRKEGKAVKIFRHEGIYTIPGKGITAYTYYSVK